MSADMQNTDKIVTFVDECHNMNLELTSPNVNTGLFEFTVNRQGQIVYGLGAIKGLGEGAIESIIECREQQGPYRHLFDFCARVDLKKVNKRSLEALVLAGALDDIGPPSKSVGDLRPHLLAWLPRATQTAEQEHQNQAAGITDMFGAIVESAPGLSDEAVYNEALTYYPWSNREVLQKERETIGLYLNGHPLDDYVEEIYELCGRRIKDLKVSRNKQWIGGLVVSMRTIKTKRGDSMAIVSLDDRSGRIDVTLFADAFNQARGFMNKDAFVFIEGQVEHDDYTGALRMRGEQSRPLYEMRKSRIKALSLSVDGLQHTHELVAEIKRCLIPYCVPSDSGGCCPPTIAYRQNGYAGEFVLGSDWHVEPSDELIHRLKQLLGPESVRLKF